jgi:hypothetical protein
MFGALLDRVRPDVVHVHHLMYLGASLLEEAWIRKIPTVMVLADFWALCPRVTLYDMNRQVCPGPERVSRCDECFTSWRVRGPTAVARSRRKGPTHSGTAASTHSGAGSSKEWQAAASVRLSPGRCWVAARGPLAPSECLRETYVRHGTIPAPFSRCGTASTRTWRRDASRMGRLRFGFVGIQPQGRGARRGVPGSGWPEATLSVHGDLGTDVHGSAARARAPRPRVRLCGRFERRDLARPRLADVPVVPSVWLNTPFVALEAQGRASPSSPEGDGLASDPPGHRRSALRSRQRVTSAAAQAFQKDPDLLNRMSREALARPPVPARPRHGEIWERRSNRAAGQREDCASTPVMKARHRRMLAEQIDWL